MLDSRFKSNDRKTKKTQPTTQTDPSSTRTDPSSNKSSLIIISFATIFVSTTNTNTTTETQRLLSEKQVPRHSYATTTRRPRPSSSSSSSSPPPSPAVTGVLEMSSSSSSSPPTTAAAAAAGGGGGDRAPEDPQQQQEDDNANDDANDDDDGNYYNYFGSHFREWRHSPCLMRPVSLVMFFMFGLFLFMTLLLQVPALVLGVLLSPILQRSAWYVEHLYALPVGRWAHFLLMKATASRRHRSDDKNRGFHSRTVEQKIEVVPGRVYIHPIPQWLDNLGYLIVCLPEPTIERTEKSIIMVEDGRDPIVGLLIDCGECPAVVRALELVSSVHYKKRPIQLQVIASTHKHHDHTGGNAELLDHSMGRDISRVYGGAVEKVPSCTDFLVDGQELVLPSFQSNDMNEVVEMEAIGVPAHTRGSLVYRLRSIVASTNGNGGGDGDGGGNQTEFVFTGDTIFSGGAGVPFEADIGVESDRQVSKSNGNTFVRGNLGTTAMERCFAEVLSRTMPDDTSNDAGDRILVFPGHEYTEALLARQFQSPAGEQGRWKNLPPQDFFETASQLYTALHRRSLPHNSGKLLMVPTTLQREIRINTHFRSLRRSAELVVRAIVFWYHHFCKQKVDQSQLLNGISEGTRINQNQRPKSPSMIKKWNINASDVSRNVFTTVYTADFESVIEDLRSGKLSKKAAADQLRSLTQRMDVPTVNKRAIPGFMPSDKNIYRGICALTLLGSRPCSMTVSDSRRMKLAPPMDFNSDKTMVSMNRLILVLRRLGLIRFASGEDVGVMIRQLWKEANEMMVHSADVESSNAWHDEIDLGLLKWNLYGVSANQPSWFSKTFCMPCSNVSAHGYHFPEHPACKMNQKSGELVAHDVLTCLLCRNATGNIEMEEKNQISSHYSDEVPLQMSNDETKISFRELESGDSLNEEGTHELEELAESILKQSALESIRS